MNNFNRYPTIDLHGLDKDSVKNVTNDFIAENLFLKNEMIVIIHGIGNGIVKKEVHEALRVNKNVIEYKTDNLNAGYTIVKLKIDLKNKFKNELTKLDYLYYVYDKESLVDG